MSRETSNLPIFTEIMVVGHTYGDTFDFQLTTEPTASEGRYIGDCEPKLYLTTDLLSDGAQTVDGLLAVDQSVEVLGQPMETYSMTYGHIDFAY